MELPWGDSCFPKRERKCGKILQGITVLVGQKVSSDRDLIIFFLLILL